MTRPITLRRLKNEVRRLDPEVKEGTSTHSAYLALLASAVVGPDIKRVAKLCKLRRDTVALFSKRLRRSRVWVGSRVACAWFEEGGGLELALDVNVALGFLERAP